MALIFYVQLKANQFSFNLGSATYDLTKIIRSLVEYKLI